MVKTMTLVIFGILVTLAYLVPFTVLSRVPRFSGSFLFWVAFAGAAVGTLYSAMRSWHE